MEDAAIARCDLTPDVSLFAVFDGHGGKEVAYFAEKHFAEELLKNKNFSALNFELALKETFLKIDELILTPAGQREINSIKGGHDDESKFNLYIFIT
jgi:protein phosphatase 1G